MKPDFVNSFTETLQRRKVLISCGLGGVGKTTVSSALALRAAISGKRALVITMDPAKRLATSLGLDHLGDAPSDLTHLLKNVCEKQGIECRGELFAIMPDTQKTFENFIHQLTSNETLANRIIQNPIFQIFAKDYSGANEYMALEKLYRINQQKRFDLIVLDTPPSRNAVNFLNAPRLLSRFFEERLIQWLVLPANKLLSSSMKKALSLLENLTGSGFMGHLLEFCSSLFEISGSFASNLKKMTALLESRDVGFILVMSPSPDSSLNASEEALQFMEELKSRGCHFDGMILNRSLLGLPLSREEKSRIEAGQASQELNKAIHLIESLQQREKQSTEALFKTVSSRMKKTPLYAKLPELARDVHSLDDLLYVAMALEENHDQPNPS